MANFEAYYWFILSNINLFIMKRIAVAVYAKMYHEMINEFQYGFGKCLYELYITYISKVDCNTFASIKNF